MNSKTELVSHLWSHMSSSSILYNTINIIQYSFSQLMIELEGKDNHSYKDTVQTVQSKKIEKYSLGKVQQKRVFICNAFRIICTNRQEYTVCLIVAFQWWSLDSESVEGFTPRADRLANRGLPPGRTLANV